MKELEIISTIKNTLGDSSFIGDDTAWVDGMVFTQDTLVENLHFSLDTIVPQMLAIKALQVNLSDLAAAGSVPCYCLISLSLPPSLSENFVKDFYVGIDKVCLQTGLKVIGGDVTGGERVVISVAMIGRSSRAVGRGGAKEGDVVFVTGEHGNSCAGLEILSKKLSGENFYNDFIDAHLAPVAKLLEGQTILNNTSRLAMMDSSDGLGDALFKIAQSSFCTLCVDFQNIPINSNLPVFAKDNLEFFVFFGGEDYELVGAMPKDDFEVISKKIKLYKIGEVVKKQDCPVIVQNSSFVRYINEKIIMEKSFNHFKGGEG